MIRTALAIALVLIAGCSESKDSPHRLSRQAISVRGWIDDVAGAQRAENFDLEIARRTTIFQATSVWVEGTPYASGGVAENGAFIVLDVPPNNAILGFNAPGAETARIVLQNVPGTADVLIPDVILKNGGATVRDPKAIRIRVPGRVDEPRPTGQTAIVAGYHVPIMEVPLADMTDRREYPDPGGFRPVAVVK